MDEAWDIGCVKLVETTFDGNTGIFAGIWIGIWLMMIFQLMAVKHTGFFQFVIIKSLIMLKIRNVRFKMKKNRGFYYFIAQFSV
jgi:hypothetical protein